MQKKKINQKDETFDSHYLRLYISSYKKLSKEICNNT